MAITTSPRLLLLQSASPCTCPSIRCRRVGTRPKMSRCRVAAKVTHDAARLSIAESKRAGTQCGTAQNSWHDARIPPLALEVRRRHCLCRRRQSVLDLHVPLLRQQGEVGPSATLALIAEILSKLRVELVSVGHERGVLRVGDTLLEPHRRVDGRRALSISVGRHGRDGHGRDGRHGRPRELLSFERVGTKWANGHFHG